MTEHLEQIIVTAPRATRLTYPEAGKAQLDSLELPPLQSGNVLLKTLFSGVSRGTEALVFSGRVPKSEHERMRCPHMVGGFEFPVSYGYACVCKVVAVGETVEDFKLADRVFVLHPHQDVFQVPAAACNPIPSNIPAKRAILTANMETAINAVWEAEIEATPKIAVIGAGVVGLLTAHAIQKIAKITPHIIDIDQKKEVPVNQLGLKFINASTPNKTNGSEYDLIFHTSASASGLQYAIDNATFEAKIIEMSWYGDKPVELNLGGAFHSKRLRLISSQVGAIAPSMRAKLNHADRIGLAMQLLTYHALDALLEPAINFHDLPDHVHNIFSPNNNGLCQLIEYTGQVHSI